MHACMEFCSQARLTRRALQASAYLTNPRHQARARSAAVSRSSFAPLLNFHLLASSTRKSNKNVKLCITMDSSSTVSCDFSSESLSLSRSRSQSFSESLSSIGPDSNPGTKLQLVERIIEPLDYYSTRRFHPVHLMDTFKGSRYRVIRKLGYGSFSTVWLARDTK